MVRLSPQFDRVLQEAYDAHGILSQQETPTASGAAFSMFFWPEKDTDSLRPLPGLLNRIKEYTTEFSVLRPAEIAKLKLGRAPTYTLNFYPKGSAALQPVSDLPFLPFAIGAAVLGLAGAWWEESRK